ncbi:adenosylcobinamide-GDP ribazoletransferase [Thiomicrorhabdus xiamenensis]|uniref:Adenosylcobinamide-GDP ribazoletransferase n=1 Tax=Thiomicrorhabdus xiamenensis TaxID=2739063 RepID=A0A7D4NY92_9GAMM|nr:adenosylcobinamide-GDP ribazoletransferase [Thiomicrorhabdus xiamenensis]QKI89018.1 adenosylcobinamide-GDP ribazoletransferase [Thiomicrorhabdus xiamenensis]
MRHFFRELCLSLQFFSRIPFNFACYSEQRQTRVLNYLPLVGLLFAGLLSAAVLSIALMDLWLADLSGREHFFSAAEAAFVVLVVWLGLSGAMHLDGVADSADAAMGSLRDPEKALRIMHDSRIGTAAAVALVVVLLGKWILLQQLIEIYWQARDPFFWMPILLLAASVIMARIAPLVLVKTAPSATRTDMHQAMFAEVSWWSIGIYGVAMSLMLLWMVPGGLSLWGALLLVVPMIAVFARRLIGGLNGDLLGMAIELSELLLLFVGLGLLRLSV